MPAVKTYTRIWDTKKTLYALGDTPLPVPIKVFSAMVTIISGVIWVPLALAIIPGGSSIKWVIALGVPVALGIMGDKPIFEGKNVVEYVISQVTYFFVPARLSDLVADDDPPGTYYVNEQKLWTARKPISQKARKRKSKSKTSTRTRKDKKS